MDVSSLNIISGVDNFRLRCMGSSLHWRQIFMHLALDLPTKREMYMSWLMNLIHKYGAFSPFLAPCLLQTVQNCGRYVTSRVVRKSLKASMSEGRRLVARVGEHPVLLSALPFTLGSRVWDKGDCGLLESPLHRSNMGLL